MNISHIHKKHNVNLLVYHLVCPAKYRREIFTKDISNTLKNICMELSLRYEIEFIEIGTDINHVHFLVQTIPSRSISDTVKIIKSLTAKELFKQHPEIKKFLWGGNLWTSGYYINTVGQYGNLKILTNYVKNQGLQDYNQIHLQQPTLCEI